MGCNYGLQEKHLGRACDTPVSQSLSCLLFITPSLLHSTIPNLNGHHYHHNHYSATQQYSLDHWWELIKQRRRGQVGLPSGSSMSWSHMLHSPLHDSLYHSHCQVPNASQQSKSATRKKYQQLTLWKHTILAFSHCCVSPELSSCYVLPQPLPCLTGISPRPALADLSHWWVWIESRLGKWVSGVHSKLLSI